QTNSSRCNSPALQLDIHFHLLSLIRIRPSSQECVIDGVAIPRLWTLEEIGPALIRRKSQ
ncbi:MAG: hypothetical protein ACRD3O_22525, partial [Terriglobia bacterium]